MELNLSLGAAPGRNKEKPFAGAGGKPSIGLKLGFCRVVDEKDVEKGQGRVESMRGYTDPPVQLNLLLLPAHQPIGFSHETENTSLEAPARDLDVNLTPSADSPASSDQMNIAACGSGGDVGCSVAEERPLSRASDEEENGGSRKKLRLSKEQSAFLEENFKEHSTLNPKQKNALAKRLNLRPRQVEVWFQNRRARTKLKQTEVDCDYLKRCCEALTEENRRLQKELSDLRALKSFHPYYTQLSATTLSMCAACERAAKTPAGGGSSSKTAPLSASLSSKARLHAFAKQKPAPAHQPSAAS